MSDSSQTKQAYAKLHQLLGVENVFDTKDKLTPPQRCKDYYVYYRAMPKQYDGTIEVSPDVEKQITTDRLEFGSPVINLLDYLSKNGHPLNYRIAMKDHPNDSSKIEVYLKIPKKEVGATAVYNLLNRVKREDIDPDHLRNNAVLKKLSMLSGNKTTFKLVRRADGEVCIRSQQKVNSATEAMRVLSLLLDNKEQDTLSRDGHITLPLSIFQKHNLDEKLANLDIAKQMMPSAYDAARGLP